MSDYGVKETQCTRCGTPARRHRTRLGIPHTLHVGAGYDLAPPRAAGVASVAATAAPLVPLLELCTSRAGRHPDAGQPLRRRRSRGPAISGRCCDRSGSRLHLSSNLS